MPRKLYTRKLSEMVLSKNPTLDNYSIDIIEKLLTLDPRKRLTAV